MNKLFKISFLAALPIICLAGLSYCATIDIPQLVDNFKNATDLQRTQIINDSIGKEVTGTGKVINAEEYDLFDTTNDVKGVFFRISTEAQKTPNNTAYQIYFLFKDKDKAADADKGSTVTKNGKIMQINDERLLISIWVYCAELSDTDKTLFKQSQPPAETQSLP
ncbi:MAG: hypothetical protein NTY47_06980 [Candidatus Omnitrophica bacterium]|nr:hypothetical protein [Candidatus Omnitrophota bacterium]